MIKASFYCALTITVLFLFIGFSCNESAIAIDSAIIISALITGGFVGVISFIFCAVLLAPLIPIFQRTSLDFSFVLFAIIGFYIPAFLGYFASTISVHGEVPAIYKADNIQAILSILYLGLTGASGAASAWFSLKHDMVPK